MGILESGWLSSGLSTAHLAENLKVIFRGVTSGIRAQMAGETMKERVEKLEQLLGEWNYEEGTVTAWALEAMNELRVQKDLAKKHAKHVEAQVVSLKAELLTVREAQSLTLQTLQEEVAILKKVVLRTSPRTTDVVPKVKVPEPKGFDGTRSAKELENFLWDMEQFFRAAQVADEEKVSITGMYLMGDAKLWWRTRLEGDAESGRPRISTWETLKRELKEQFLPTNAVWLARESLRRLKHTGTVRDYVKEFSSLMLDIKNMSEEDKLFNFVSGLQAWAQTELRRQGVKDLPSAMEAANFLVDYKLLGTTIAGSKPKMDGSRKQKVTGKPSPDQTKGKKEGNAANLRTGESQNGQQTSKPSGCFIC